MRNRRQSNRCPTHFDGESVDIVHAPTSPEMCPPHRAGVAGRYASG
jgi:hypothetical protein